MIYIAEKYSWIGVKQQSLTHSLTQSETKSYGRQFDIIIELKKFSISSLKWMKKFRHTSKIQTNIQENWST